MTFNKLLLLSFEITMLVKLIYAKETDPIILFFALYCFLGNESGNYKD